MKLVSLDLKNFRQHIATTIEFRDGITGIIGNNGAGKSTIIEAIAFCLYGSKALRGKIKDVRTYGLNETLLVSAELVFEHEGDNYRVYRDLSEAKLFYSGQTQEIASGNKNVVYKIEEILGLNLEEFLASYYTEQKALEFLSGKKGATEREKFITRMIGYDRLENMQSLVREDKRDLKNQIQGLAAGIGEKEELETRLKNQKGINSQLLEQEKSVIKSLESAELQETNAKKEFKVLEADYAEYQKQQKELDSTELKLKLNQKNAQELKNENQQLTKIINQQIGKSEDLDQLESTLKLIAEKYEQEQTDVSSLEKELSSETSKRQEKLSRIKQEIAVTDSQIKTIATKLIALKKLKTGADCPTCGQVLGDEFKEVATKLTKEKAALEKQLAGLVKKSEEISKETKQEINLSAKLDKLKNDFQQTSDKLQKLRSAQSEIISLSKNKKRIAELEKDDSELEKSLTYLKEKLEKINFSENSYLAAKSKYEAAASLVSSTRMQKVRQEGKLRESQALLERAEEDLLQFKQKQAELTAKKNDLNLLEQTDQTLTDFRRYLNQTVKPRLAELASSYLTDLSDGRYSNLNITEDFSTEVYEDGHLKKTLSGGEEDILNICLRLALSSLIAERAGHNLSFLILDEVFGSLDENRRFNVLSLLERLHNRFEQIILITHLDDIKDSVNNLIYIDYDEARSELAVSSSVEQIPEVNL